LGTLSRTFSLLAQILRRTRQASTIGPARRRISAELVKGQGDCP
jgi:hypothetical protein